MEAEVEINTVGAIPAGRGFRQVEEAAAQRPAALVPLRGRAISKSPAIGSVVERPGIESAQFRKSRSGSFAYCWYRRCRQRKACDCHTNRSAVGFRRTVDVGCPPAHAPPRPMVCRMNSVVSAIGIVLADLVGFPLINPATPRVMQAQIPDRSRDEPEFGALPEPGQAHINVMSMVSRGPGWKEAIVADKGDEGGYLPVRSLAVEVNAVRSGAVGPYGSLPCQARRTGSSCPHEPLGGKSELKVAGLRKQHSVLPKRRTDIRAGGPVGRDRNLDAAPGRPAEPVQQKANALARCPVGSPSLVASPCVPAGAIEEPGPGA